MRHVIVSSLNRFKKYNKDKEIKMWRKIHKKLHKFFISKPCKLFADSTLFIATGYLMFKKVYAFTISGWLLNNAFHQPMVDVFIFICAMILVAALVSKLFAMILEILPPKTIPNVELDNISYCIKSINNEIAGHIEKCLDPAKCNIKELNEQHRFNLNLNAIVDRLASHIADQFKELSKKDVFISVYQYDASAEELKYLFHSDPNRSWVKSKSIKLSDHRYNDYECIKCLKSNDASVYVLEKEKYAEGEHKRYKSMMHYMGFKLFSGDDVYGFLNVEIHNHSVFSDEDQIQEFMLSSIIAFKLLMEYQFLKQRFFQSFKNFDNHWRSA